MLISFISGPDPEGITPVYYLGRDGQLHHIQSLTLPKNGLVQIESIKFAGAEILSGGYSRPIKAILHVYEVVQLQTQQLYCLEISDIM